jgi:CelD/BcsL family acetyltransferase involved in cellulose biosynthesis
VEAATPAALSRYRQFALDAVTGIPQLPGWVEAWTETMQPDAFVVDIRRGTHHLASVPLEVVRRGPIRIARFMGGSHANGNFPATRRNSPPLAAAWLGKSLKRAVAEARRDVDVLLLERQLRTIDGVENPFSALPSIESPNLALATRLEDGFDGVLKRHSEKRRLKKRRAQLRKFEEAGGYRRIEARSPEEVRRLLEAFLAMKSARLRATGLPDVFSGPQMHRFLETLFLKALEDEPPSFFLDGLEVGGRLRAITGSSQACGRVVCEFGAIADDDLVHASPGEFLFFDNIDDACRKGHALFDFSVGDEAYKRMWSDIEIRHFDCCLPLSARGLAYAAMHRVATPAKRLVKANPALHDMAKRLRMNGVMSNRD